MLKRQFIQDFGAGYQMFVRDPVGTVIEFNFPNDEAPGAGEAARMPQR